MRLLKLLIFILLTTTISFAQSEEIDSLSYVIEHATSDSVITVALQQKCYAYRKIDSLELGYETALEMLESARKEGDEKRIGWGMREVAFNLHLLKKDEEGIKLLNDYIETLDDKDTSVLAETYRFIGSLYVWEENYSEALKYYFKAHHYYELMGKEIRIIGNISSAYSRLNDEKNAAKYNLMYIELAKKRKI